MNQPSLIGFCRILDHYKDIEELLTERGVQVDHATTHRWVCEYAPQLEVAFRRRKRPVDKYGAILDFMLSKKRDELAARRFFHKAIAQHG